MGVLLEWVNGRGFVNSDHIVSVKCHIDNGQLKLYARDVLRDDHLIRDPSDTDDFEYRLDWEKEARKKIVAVEKFIQGDDSVPEIPETKKTVVRKAK